MADVSGVGGPFFMTHLKQNDKLKRWHFHFLAAVDGWSRYQVYSELVTNTRCHAKFFQSMVRSCGSFEDSFAYSTMVPCAGRVPGHIVVDKGQWDAVEALMDVYYGQTGPTTIQLKDPFHVYRVQGTADIKSFPRHWVDLNNVMATWIHEFKDLEKQDLLRCHDSVDIWCLHQAYRDAITKDANIHFGAMNLIKRDGMRRPKEMFFLHGSDQSLHVDGDVIDAVDGFLARESDDDDISEDWEVDPLSQDPAACAERNRLLAMAPSDSPKAFYINLRYVTHALVNAINTA